MNIDTHLITLINHPQLNLLISIKDANALRGLYTTIKNHYFLTEGQAQFLLSLLNANKNKLISIIPELEDDLKTPSWSKQFRIIEVIRTVKITNYNDEKVILVESNYSNSFKSLMSQLSKSLMITVIVPGKEYVVQLTENNVVEIVNNLQLLNFDICDELLKYYNEITSWDAHDIISNFGISTIANEEARQMIIDDIGHDTPLDSLIINDRKLRYQYYNNYNQYNAGDFNEPISLTELIANRVKTNIWIDKNQYSLTDIILSLKELKRLPLLIIFDKTNDKNSCNELNCVSDALEQNGITDNIGIYYRLSNTLTGKPFNKLISDKHYNSKLDENTVIAGIEISNLPKFFLTSNWEPMAVIYLNQYLRNTKTSIYSNRCDLIITYSTEQPLIQTRFY